MLLLKYIGVLSLKLESDGHNMINNKEKEIYQARLDKAVLNLDQDSIVSTCQQLIRTNQIKLSEVDTLLDNESNILSRQLSQPLESTLKSHIKAEIETLKMAKNIIDNNLLKYWKKDKCCIVTNIKIDQNFKL